MNPPPSDSNRSTPTVSVVIATFNGGPWILDQMRSVLSQDVAEPFEVIVAENGSSDDTESLILDLRDQSAVPITVIDATGQRGQCFARNEGARSARGRYLVFLDQDDVIEPGYLSAIRSALDEFDLAAARIDHERLNPDWRAASRRPAQVERLGEALGFLPYAGGQTLGIRREMFESVGGFDSQMPGAAEDVDLCWRVQLAGGTLGYVPDAVINYRYRWTLREQAAQAFCYGDASVSLYQRYRQHGMKRRSPREFVHALAVLLKQAMRVRNKADLARVVWKGAHLLGTLRSAVVRRTLYL